MRPPPTRPLVSVVIAAHDAARHVGAALASLSRQTVDDLEVIVVDDGSTDSTAAAVEEEARRDRRVRLLRLRRNRGQAAALNAGVALARGRWLAVLDADDEATPERLARQLAALEADRELVLVGGAVEPFCDRLGAAGQPWRYATGDGAIRARSLFKSEFISGAMTLDRERLARHRLRFDERLRVGADWALSLGAMRVGRVANLEDVVMRYRVHSGQLTSGMMDDTGSDSARIRVEALARLGVRPTDDELRIHLAVSPCNYWPFGAHPYFRERRATIAEDARRWFARLLSAAARGGTLPVEALGPYLDEIASLVAARAADPAPAPGTERGWCPVAGPKTCLGQGDAWRACGRAAPVAGPAPLPEREGP